METLVWNASWESMTILKNNFLWFRLLFEQLGALTHLEVLVFGSDQVERGEVKHWLGHLQVLDPFVLKFHSGEDRRRNADHKLWNFKKWIAVSIFVGLGVDHLSYLIEMSPDNTTLTEGKHPIKRSLLGQYIRNELRDFFKAIDTVR